MAKIYILMRVDKQTGKATEANYGRSKRVLEQTAKKLNEDEKSIYRYYVVEDQKNRS